MGAFDDIPEAGTAGDASGAGAAKSGAFDDLPTVGQPGAGGAPKAAERKPITLSDRAAGQDWAWGKVKQGVRTLGEAVGLVEPPSVLDDPAVHKGAERPQSAAPSMAPVDAKMRQQFNAAWDAATPEQRTALSQRNGWIGQLARERAGLYDNPQATITETGRKFDTRAESRVDRLVGQGEDPRFARVAAQRGALGAVTPGQEVAAMGDTIQPSKFDFDTAAQFDPDAPANGLNRTLGRGLAKGGAGLTKAVAGYGEALADFLGTDAAGQVMKELGDWARGKEDAIGNRGDFLQRNMEGAIASIAQQLPLLALGAANSSQAIPLAGMAVQAFGQEYSDGRDAKLTPQEAATRASLMASFEVIGEKFGLGQQLDLLRRSAKGVETGQLANFFGEWIGNTLKREIPGELLTTTGQFGVDKFGGEIALRPDATWADYTQQVADTIAQTVLQGGIMAGGTTGVAGASGYMRSGGEESAAQAENEALAARDRALRAWENARAKGFLVEPPAPTDKPSVRRSKSVEMFKELGAMFGIPQAAQDLAIQHAEKQPVQALPGFFARYAQALQKRGLVGAELDPDVIEAMSTAGSIDMTPTPAEQPAQQADTIAAVPQGSLAAQLDATGLPEDVAPTAPTAQAPATSVDISTPVDAAAHQAATSPTNDLPEPTQAMKDAGNYKVGRTRIAGLDIRIENPQGSKRRGTAPDGTPWETEMRAHYGYVAGTEAADGDKLDVFVKAGTPEDWRGPVFVIDQVDPATGELDEHKVVMGVADEAEAEALYRSNYDADWQGFGAITRLPLPAFKAWAKSGRLKEPLGDIAARPQLAPNRKPTNEPQPPQAQPASTAVQTDQAPADPGRTAEAGAGEAGRGVPGAGATATVEAPGVKRSAAAQRGRQQFQIDPERDTMLQALAKLGGIRRDVVASEFGLKPEELKFTVSTGKLKAYPFRKTGGMDLDQAMTALTEAGYFDAVAPDEVRTAFEEAIYSEMGGSPRYTSRGEMRRAEDAYNDRAQDALAQQAELDAEALAEREAIMAEAGLTEEQLSAHPDQAIEIEARPQSIADGMRAMGFTEQEIADELAKAGNPTLQGREGSRAQDPEVASRQAQAPPGSGDAAARPAGGDRREPRAAGSDAGQGQEQGNAQGLTLQAQTEQDLRTKAQREDAATKAEAAKKAAEQARIKKADDERDARARADATVDDFQLGQSADQQLSGMDDMFAPQATPGSARGDVAGGSRPTPAAQPRQADADGNAQRTLDVTGRASDGKPIAPGDVFRTASGRMTTPYPKQKSEKYASQWLIDNAVSEADSRGDGFNAPTFKAAKPGRDGELTPADRDSMLEYLFGQQPNVTPSILKPLSVPGKRPGTLRSNAADTDEVRQAKADAMKALGDLADIFSKGTRLNMVPEQEQKLLPVLTRLFDAAFRLGYLKFKEAARFALDQIRDALGDDVADQITLEHLQGGYIGMSGRYKGQGADSVMDVAQVTSIDQIPQNLDQESTDDVSSTRTDLESDRTDAAGGQRVLAVADGEGSAAADRGAGEAGERPGAQGSRRGSDAGVPAGGTSAARNGGDQPVRPGRGKPGASLVPAGSDVDQRGGGFGDAGVPVETVSADATRRVTQDGLAQGLTNRAQREANTQVKLGDIDNIRETLPALLPGQQDDVRKAEERFAKPDGFGILFTNGTGTGKTFTGLGIVKRMALQGKENILLVAPSDKVIEDWINSGKVLGLNITKLTSTKDAGKGMVITTYANLGDNQVLGDRRWDAAVLDEAHYLMASKDGEVTNALKALRAVTYHPDGVSDLGAMRNRELGAKVKELSEKIKSLDKIMGLDDLTFEVRASYQRERDALEKQYKPLSDQLKEANGKVREEVLGNQGAKRPRVTFLSATPWAYVQALDWSNGYLFEFDEGKKQDGASGTGGRAYNEGSNRQQFYMQHFGYRMRYNKLTRPDAKVDRGLMERQFNAWLRQQGVLSRRALDVAADYDRRFILLESAIGTRIDEALSWVSERAYGNKEAGIEGSQAFQKLSGAINDKFDYLSRRYLLEAIKATEVIPIVRQHLAKGRKVVVFHDFKLGGGFNPFAIKSANAGEAMTSEQADAFNAALFEFQGAFPDLINYPFERMPSPIQVFSREFPDLLLFNGDVAPKDRREAVKTFQDDATGPRVILVQSAAGKEGISLHDTTGKHQRALINLGQPTAPTTAIQQEGRIYRTGQVTDAILRYLTTGTTWERYAFASQVATRSATVENLAAGEEARALADAFIAAYEEADTFEPGHEGEGTGGKQRDKAAYEALTEFDRAVSFYYGTQKKNAKTKAKEGADYFATPEPLGLKMVEWANVHAGDSVLEPSAGHGAIARWFPQSAQRTAVEPSLELRSRLAMVFGDGKIVGGDFESHHVVNKYDAIVMNPPFGSGGRTAVDHLAKAADHLREGGRIVAIIPTGPAADKKFDKWFYEEDTKPVKPLTTIEYGMGPQELFRGDVIKTRASFAPQGTVLRMNAEGTGVWVKVEGKPGETMVTLQSITAHARTGPRTETFKPAEGLHLVADLKLPQVAFERAGTNVATRVVVIEKAREGEVAPAQRNADFTGTESVEDFFKRIRDYSLPNRAKPAPTIEELTAPEAEAPKADARQAAKAEKATAQRQGTELAAGAGMEIVEHTTAKGKVLKGVIRKDMTQAQAKEIDAYTFKKDGGWFIRAEHIPKMVQAQPDEGSSFSVAPVFISELAEQVQRSPMNAGTAGAWQQYLDALAKRGAIKADEVEWTGLREWLALQPGKISKADISTFLDANGVQVSEVTLSGDEYDLMEDPVVEERDDGLWAVMDPDTGEQIGGDYATQEDAQAAVQEMVSRSDGAAKFERWTVPGGQNYREVLLTLPSDTPAEDRNTAYYRETTQDFKSSHWDQPNVLAHIRVDERTDADGKRVLFVQEVQSDWGQQGKKKGIFNPAEPYEVFNVQTGETVARHSDMRAAAKDAVERGVMFDYKDERTSGFVPPAPFIGKTDAWVGLAIKRVIKMAADEGFDRVAFIKGQQAADLFDLSKQVERIDYDQRTKNLVVYDKTGGRPITKTVTPEELPDVIGKEAAEKLLQAPGLDSGFQHSLRGLDLKVGGEGMRTFYDQIVPKVAKDVLRKVGGGQLTTMNLVTRNPGNARKPGAKPIDFISNGFDITPAIREKAARGLPLFSRGAADGVGGGVGGGSGVPGILGIGARPTFAPGPARPTVSRVDLDKLIVRNADNWAGIGLDRLIAVDNWAELPDQVLADARKKGFHPGLIEGVVHRNRVYLVRSALRDVDHAERVLFHEAYGHMGTRIALEGKPTEALNTLWDKLNGLAGVAKLAKKHQVGDGMTAWDRLQPYVRGTQEDVVSRRAKIMDELIAFLAQANDTSALTQFKTYLADLKGAMVALARRLGLNGLADRLDRAGAEMDVLQLVRDARRAVRTGTSRQGSLVVFGADPAPAFSEGEQAGQFSVATPTGFNLPEFGRTGKFVEAIQDRYNRWKQAVETVRQQGGTVTEANDFYAAEERYWGIVGAQLDDFKAEVETFVKDVQADDLALSDVALYAYAKHAPERNARIAEINAAFPDGGSGMTDAEAAAILAKAKADGIDAQLERHVGQLQRWSARTREILRDNGLITPEEFDAWDTGYQHYVPLRGKPGQPASRGGMGQGFDIRGKESFRAMGRRSMAGNVIEHILQDRARALVRSGKNEVLRRFARFVLDNPDPQLWTVNAVKTRRALVDTPMGEQVVEWQELNDDRNETVGVKDAGRTLFIEVKDPVLLKQLKNLNDEPSLSVVIESLLWANRLLSRMYTSLNPVFTVLNGARDATAGTINMLGVAGPAGARRMAANLPAAYREAFRAEVLNKPSAMYEEYRRTGGKTGFMDFKDIEAYGEELAAIAAESQQWSEAVKQEGWQKARALWLRSRGTARRALDRIEDLNASVENATRFASYKAARESGKSVAEAASIAKNITVNFNRKGTRTPALAAVFLFFNPAVQGTTRMLQALQSRDVQAALGSAMVGVFALALANASMGDEDEGDGITYWDKIPENVKDRNLVIMLPPGSDAGEKIPGTEYGRYIKIPLPYGYNTFATLATTVADVARNQMDPKAGVTAAAGAQRVFKSFIGSWLPASDVAPSFDNEKSIALAFVPDAIDPVLEPVLNINSFGSSMYPAGQGYDTMPDSEKVFAGQRNGAAHRFATWMNEATGGSQYHSGAVSVTPATINNVVRGYGGGVASFIMSVGDVFATQGVSRDTPEWWRAPFAKQLFGTVDMIQDQGLAYERLQQIDAAAVPLKRAEKAGDKRAAEAIRDDAGAIAGLGKMADQARQRLTEIRKQEIRIIESERLTPAEKNAALRQWDRERQRVYDRVNRSWARAVESDAYQPE